MPKNINKGAGRGEVPFAPRYTIQEEENWLDNIFINPILNQTIKNSKYRLLAERRTVFEIDARFIFPFMTLSLSQCQILASFRTS